MNICSGVSILDVSPSNSLQDLSRESSRLIKEHNSELSCRANYTDPLGFRGKHFCHCQLALQNRNQSTWAHEERSGVMQLTSRTTS